MFNEIEQELFECLRMKMRYVEYLEVNNEKLEKLRVEIETLERKIKECDEQIKELKEKL